MLLDVIIETLLFYLIPGAIHAILTIAAVTLATFIFLLIVERSIVRIRYQFFQSLDFYGFKMALLVMAVSYLIVILFFSEEARVMLILEFSIIGTYLLLNHYVDALDDEMQEAFNDGKSWFQSFCNKEYKVESRYLKFETYEYQRAKIQTQLAKRFIGVESSKKLEHEISQTKEIIENINELYRKSLKGETTMLKNKDLLWKLYVELKDRYEYFEQKYHDLLQEKYGIKHDIAQMIIKNTQQKDNHADEEGKKAIAMANHCGTFDREVV